jgi:hypothetical protein
MDKEKTSLTFYIEFELLRLIDDLKHRHKFPSRSYTIRELLSWAEKNYELTHPASLIAKKEN